MNENMVREKTFNIKFWDKNADKYSKSPIADEVTYQKKLELTRNHFTPDAKVLEFGCGTGSTAILHAPLVAHIEAIDLSTNMLAIAKQKATTGQIKNIDFKHASINHYTALDESFDVILGMSILHLLEDKEVVLKKIFDMLKPGGVFISSTACIGEKMPFFKMLAPIGQFFRLMPIVKVFSVKQLKTSITEASFEIDFKWLPKKSMAVFIIAKKPNSALKE